MKLVKRGESVVAIVEYLWENLHLKAQRVVMEWLQLFLTGKSAHMKEFDPERLQVRFCAGQELRDQKEVVFRAS